MFSSDRSLLETFLQFYFVPESGLKTDPDPDPEKFENRIRIHRNLNTGSGSMQKHRIRNPGYDYHQSRTEPQIHHLIILRNEMVVQHSILITYIATPGF